MQWGNEKVKNKIDEKLESDGVVYGKSRNWKPRYKIEMIGKRETTMEQKENSNRIL